MGLFSNKTNATSIDKNTPAYAVSKYNSARSNLLVALIFTVANMLLGALGSGVYMLFSIYFPYCMFDITDIVWSVPALAVLALFVVCYIFSKKKPGFMIAALVTFILDFLFLIGYSILVSRIPELGITIADFLIDYLTHIWVLVYLFIGARYSKRYKAAINQNPELVLGSIFTNAALPMETLPETTNPEENASDDDSAF